jgi:GntR family transcriptional repressor for pyruvate dehydrogenase complex
MTGTSEPEANLNTSTASPSLAATVPLESRFVFSQLSRDDSIGVRIASKIVAAIDDGGFPIGSRLPTEQELAAEFRVSRASVREALSALQFAGYITSRRGYGSVVTAAEPSLSGAYAGATASGSNVDGIAVLEARLIVEVEAIRLAALDPDVEALTEAIRILHGMEVVVHQSRLAAQSDLNLHLAVVSICRNRVLCDSATHLIELTASPSWKRFRMNAWRQPELLDQWAAHHRAILDAIQRGDSKAAAHNSRTHLLSVVEVALRSGQISQDQRLRLSALEARHSGARPGTRKVRRLADLSVSATDSDDSSLGSRHEGIGRRRRQSGVIGGAN